MARQRNLSKQSSRQSESAYYSRATAELPLFDHALARTSDPSTSHEAAAAVDVSEGKQMVIRALEALGQASQEEVAIFLGHAHPAISPRFIQLERANRIRVVGKKLNRNGRNVQVYELAVGGPE